MFEDVAVHQRTFLSERGIIRFNHGERLCSKVGLSTYVFSARKRAMDCYWGSQRGVEGVGIGQEVYQFVSSPD